MHTQRSLTQLSKADHSGQPTTTAARVPAPSSKWTTRIAVPLTILATAAGLLAYSARAMLLPAVDVTAISVVTKEAATLINDADAVPSERTMLVQAPGWIEPEPFAVNVTALADGVIREMLVLEGERVEADQVIARMIADDALLGMQIVEATLAAKQAEEHAARARVQTAHAQEAIERAVADEIRDEVDRKRPLAADQTVAAGEFRRLELRLQAQEARVLAAHTAIAEAEAQVAQAKAGAEIAAAERATAQLRLDRMEIRAPSSGIVLARLAEPGSRMMTSSQDMAGAVAIRLYDPDRLQVRVDIPLADAAKVGVGFEAEVTTEALPDRVFTGRVTRIVQEADIQKNTMEVKVTIDQPPTVLKPEMLARVRFYPPKRAAGDVDSPPTSSESHASAALRIFAPTAALSSVEGDRATAWVIDEARSKPALRELRLGTRDADDWREVRTGLVPGDRVIINAPASLTESTRIRIVEGGRSS